MYTCKYNYLVLCPDIGCFHKRTAIWVFEKGSQGPVDRLPYCICWPASFVCLRHYCGDKASKNEIGWNWLVLHDWRKVQYQGTLVWQLDSKVHGAKMGPISGQQDPGGPHVGPMNFVIWVGRSIRHWSMNNDDITSIVSLNCDCNG